MERFVDVETTAVCVREDDINISSPSRLKLGETYKVVRVRIVDGVIRGAFTIYEEGRKPIWFTTHQLKVNASFLADLPPEEERKSDFQRAIHDMIEDLTHEELMEVIQNFADSVALNISEFDTFFTLRKAINQVIEGDEK